MESTTPSKWTKIPTGTRVKVLRNARQLRRDDAGNFVMIDGDYVVDDYGPGLEGVVEGITNAGFRGIEMSVRTDSGLYLPGLSAAALEIL